MLAVGAPVLTSCALTFRGHHPTLVLSGAISKKEAETAAEMAGIRKTQVVADFGNHLALFEQLRRRF